MVLLRGVGDRMLDCPCFDALGAAYSGIVMPVDYHGCPGVELPPGGSERRPSGGRLSAGTFVAGGSDLFLRNSESARIYPQVNNCSF